MERAGPLWYTVSPGLESPHPRGLLKVRGGAWEGKCIGVARKMDESGTNMKATG